MCIYGPGQGSVSYICSAAFNEAMLQEDHSSLPSPSARVRRIIGPSPHRRRGIQQEAVNTMRWVLKTGQLSDIQRRSST